MRNTSDDTQFEESGKDERWWEKLWSNKTGKEGNQGGGGEGKGGRTAKKMANEAQTQKQHASFEVVHVELVTIRTKPEG